MKVRAEFWGFLAVIPKEVMNIVMIARRERITQAINMQIYCFSAIYEDFNILFKNANGINGYPRDRFHFARARS